MSQYGYSFKGKYWILGAIGVAGLIFTSGVLQIIFGILKKILALKISSSPTVKAMSIKIMA